MRRVLVLACLLLALSASGPALSASAPTGSVSRPRWSWPVGPEHRVLTAYSPPARTWLSGHRGVDLAAPPEQAVRSPTDGTVTFSGKVAGRTVVTVSAGDYRISFEPVSRPLRRGTRVREGQQIAVRDPRIRHEDCGFCLHWGVRESEDYVNPLLFVGATGPSVLWPVPARPAWAGP